MPKRQKVYVVRSTYKVTGTSLILASSAAEAAHIGTAGYPNGFQPQFEFSEAWGETKMTAVPADEGEYPDVAKNEYGREWYPTSQSTVQDLEDGSGT